MGGREPATPQSGFLFTPQLCFSLFIFHVLSWHERDFFSLHGGGGRLRLALRSHGAQHDEAAAAGLGWGVGGVGRAAFLDSKHQNSPHKQRSISPESVLLSPV